MSELTVFVPGLCQALPLSDQHCTQQGSFFITLKHIQNPPLVKMGEVRRNGLLERRDGFNRLRHSLPVRGLSSYWLREVLVSFPAGSTHKRTHLPSGRFTVEQYVKATDQSSHCRPSATLSVYRHSPNKLISVYAGCCIQLYRTQPCFPSCCLFFS